MQIDLTGKEFRYLLDLVYIGNWVLNSIRGDNRFADYDAIESKLFGLCRGTKLQSLVENWQGEEIPSRAYAEGGIHEAIACYEDADFYEILAEELSRRDMEYPDITDDNYDEIIGRMDRYMEEFRQSGVDKLVREDWQPSENVGAIIDRPPKNTVFRIFRRKIAVFSPCGDRFCKAKSAGDQ